MIDVTTFRLAVRAVVIELGVDLPVFVDPNRLPTDPPPSGFISIDVDSGSTHMTGLGAASVDTEGQGSVVFRVSVPLGAGIGTVDAIRSCLSRLVGRTINGNRIVGFADAFHGIEKQDFFEVGYFAQFEHTTILDMGT